MKKLLIVNNNLKAGGVQQSLCSLLWEMADRYQITLLLFSGTGEFRQSLPENVQVQVCSSLFRYLGISQRECSGAADALCRGFLAGVCRILGRRAAMKLILASQKKLPEEYDAAIAFLHNGRPRSFYGGVQEFVLEKVTARKKIAFLHCDYLRSGACHPYHDQLLSRFHRIAACSDGCRSSLVQAVPRLGDRCVTVRNFHRFALIREQAKVETLCYDRAMIHVLMVARLSPEKAIHRGIRALSFCRQQGVPLCLHLVGDGKLGDALQKEGAGLPVIFHGAQENPFRFMPQADLLLITSYHEGAPMVIEEALCLGLPVLTVKTCSSREQLRGRGWECENSQRGINEALLRLCRRRDLLAGKRGPWDLHNEEALAQWQNLLESPLT